MDNKRVWRVYLEVDARDVSKLFKFNRLTVTPFYRSLMIVWSNGKAVEIWWLSSALQGSCKGPQGPAAAPPVLGPSRQLPPSPEKIVVGLPRHIRSQLNLRSNIASNLGPIFDK